MKSDEPTFYGSCILSYEAFAPERWDIHERKFNVKSTSGKTYTVIVNNFLSCTCPDCQFRDKRCKHIDFIMERVLHEKYPQPYYDDEDLDNMYKSLPWYIPHIDI